MGRTVKVARCLFVLGIIGGVLGTSLWLPSSVVGKVAPTVLGTPPALGAPAPAAPRADVQQDIAPLGQVGGMIYASEVQGNYAYIGVGARLVVWDVTNPAAPVAAGQSEILNGVVRDLELVGDYAYVAVGSGGAHILDVSTPATPTQVGAFTTYGEVVGIDVAGNYAYVASVFDYFRVFDVSDPAAPSEVGSYTGLSVAEGLDVEGNYAYIAAGGKGLQILDVSDPTNVTSQGVYASTYAREVVVSGGYAYLADAYGSPNFVVLNVSNPAAPTQAGSFAAPGEAYDLVLDGSTMYLATWSNGVRFIDVSNPTAPNELGFFNTPGRAEGVAVAGGYAYIADTWDGFKIVDVSNFSAPSQVYAYHAGGEAWDVAVNGATAYLGDRNNGFYTIDASDPAALGIDHYHAQGWDSSGEVDLAAWDRYLIVADRAKLHVFDVSDPSNPSAVGAYTALTDPRGVSVVGDYAYVADGEGGLRILDIRNPAAISEVGRLDTGGEAGAVLVSGGWAYLADGAQGLRVIDVSNPAAPSEAGFYLPGGFASDLALAGHYAYVSTGYNGLRIINVSNPSTPTEVGFYDAWIGEGVAATEGYAYVVDSQFDGELQMLDVSNPVSPTLMAEYTLPLGARKMTLDGDVLYVAAGGGGLMTFSVPEAVRLAEVRPNRGRADWANTVDVYGENLDAAAALSLVTTTPVMTTIPLSATQVSATHMRAVVPAGLAVGDYDLYVVNPDGGQATLTDAYQVLDPAADVLYAYSDELWTGPTAPRVYATAQMGLVVHRAGGSGDLAGVSVDFYDGDPASGGTLIGSGTIASLAPDSFTSTVGIDWTPSSEGFHEIYAQVNAPAIRGSRATAVTVHRSVWVLPPAEDLVPPSVDVFTLNGGAVDVSTQNVTLSISASDNPGGSGVSGVYLMEFNWNPNIGEWVRVAESGWLDYEDTPLTYNWTLAWAPGVKNLVAWAGDQAGNITLVGEVLWFNFVPPAVSVNQGQFHMYCYWLNAGQSLSAQLTPSAGDPDLYLGDASGWLDSSLNAGTASESVATTASAYGLYSVAVYGYTTARYGLSVNSGARAATAQSEVLSVASPRGGEPVTPPMLPDGRPAPRQRALPPVSTTYALYLPLVVR
jgi:hypothetical protein